LFLNICFSVSLREIDFLIRFFGIADNLPNVRGRKFLYMMKKTDNIYSILPVWNIKLVSMPDSKFYILFIGKTTGSKIVANVQKNNAFIIQEV